MIAGETLDIIYTNLHEDIYHVNIVCRVLLFCFSAILAKNYVGKVKVALYYRLSLHPGHTSGTNPNNMRH